MPSKCHKLGSPPEGKFREESPLNEVLKLVGNLRLNTPAILLPSSLMAAKDSMQSKSAEVRHGDKYARQ